MLTATLALALLTHGGTHNMRTIHVLEADCIETNHVFDKHGEHLFTQVIIWQCMESDNGRLHNVGWKIVRSNWDLPIRIGRNRFQVLHYESGRKLEIYSNCFRMRMTNQDMEREDTREFWRGSAPNCFFWDRGG